MELTVQMAMIFVGKQFLAQIMEYYMPLIWKGNTSRPNTSFIKRDTKEVMHRLAEYYIMYKLIS